MQLRDIEYVIAVAEHKNFSKAAEELCITQPALSLGIKRLEDEYGFKLFVRGRKESFLTREGELVFREAKLIAHLHRKLELQMRDIKALKAGRLSIGITSLFARFYFADAFQHFQALYPDIIVSFREDRSIGIEHSLATGVHDLALMPLPFRSTNFEYEELISEETFLALPPDYPKTPSMVENFDEYGCVNLADFSDADFIFQQQGQRIREIADQACEKMGFTPRIVFETQSIDAANAMVALGLGVSMIPSMIFKTKRDNRGVRYYHITDVDVSRKIVAAFKEKGGLSPAARAFIDVTKNAIRSTSKD